MKMILQKYLTFILHTIKMKILQLNLLILFILSNFAFSQTSNYEKVLKGHDYTVLCLDTDTSGNYLTSGSYDTDIILWDFSTGKQLKKYQGHNSGIWSIKISPDNKYIASGSWDNNVFAKGSSINCLSILDLKTFETVKLLSIKPDRYKTLRFIPELDDSTANGIRKISFKPDGSKIAAITCSGDLFIWDIDNNFNQNVLSYSKTQHELIDISPDWEYLVCCERKRRMVDSCFYFISIENNEILAKFDNPQKTIIYVCFSNNSNYIASIGGNRIKRNEIYLWDIGSQGLIMTLKGHSNVIRSLDFSKNDKFLVSVGEDNLINLWNILTGELIISFTENNEKELTSVIFSVDDKYLITGSQDKTIKYWNIADLIETN